MFSGERLLAARKAHRILDRAHQRREDFRKLFLTGIVWRRQDHRITGRTADIAGARIADQARLEGTAADIGMHLQVCCERHFAVGIGDDLDPDERQRYEVANANAHRYSASLEQRFIQPRRIGDMLDELRRFYRMSLPDKLDLIRAA